MLSRTLKRIPSYRSLKCLLCGSTVLGLIIALVVLCIIRRQSHLDTAAKLTLADLCDRHKTKKITGTLCQDLCDLKSLRFVSSFSGGANKNVILMEWHHSYIVLKSRVRYQNDLSPLTVREIKDNKRTVTSAPNADFFETIIFNEVESLLQSNIVENKHELILKLSDEKYDPDNEKPSLAFMNTLMNLIQQEEYVNFKYPRDMKFFPIVYGYCGHFYGVEFVPPDQMLSSISLRTYSKPVSWRHRAMIAVELIDIFKHLDGDYRGRSEETHMCDVKAENFGVGPDLSVKIIDGDMIFSSAKMKSILGSESCLEDSECDFFDCEGICDVENGRCTNQRRNFNFQILCRDIFSNGWRGTQLLTDPPAVSSNTIKEEVAKCSSLSREDLKNAKPGWNPSAKLRELLRDTT